VLDEVSLHYSIVLEQLYPLSPSLGPDSTPALGKNHR